MAPSAFPRIPPGAKGRITNLWPSAGATCAAPIATNGFVLTKLYLRGLGGNQDTELDGAGNWLHTNVSAGGGLTATYWQATGGPQLSHNFSDWLGTKRMQANTAPSAEVFFQVHKTSGYSFFTRDRIGAHCLQAYKRDSGVNAASRVPQVPRLGPGIPKTVEQTP